MDNLEAIFARFSSGKVCPLSYAIEAWQGQHGSLEELYAERHPLGFVKIELSNLIDSCSLSLHLWNGTQRTPIHSHHFNMKSLVFRGILLDAEFEVVADTNADFLKVELEYDVDEAQRHFLPSDGRYRAERRKARLIKNVSYHVPKAHFHSTRALIPNTASVLIRHNVGRKGSACLTTADQLTATQRDQTLSKEEVLRLLREERSRHV